MPSPHPELDADAAADIAADRGFGTPGGGASDPTASATKRLGIELEWCTVALAEPDRPADFDALQRAAAATVLPNGSRVSYEPGGQIELSTPPLPGLDAVAAARDDAAALGRALAAAGVGMLAIGLEPGPRRARALRSPRYDAMEAYFDACGEAGRTMMRSTAALQLNLDLGDPSDPEDIDRRWGLVHALGPVLIAMFANSPFRNGEPSGWKSTRTAVWQAIDPARTLPVANGRAGREAWAHYALDAGVMLIRRSDDDHVPVPPGLTFADWIARGHATGWPTASDLEYHLTTLFPPVRPRGWLELRMIDALPAPWWQVAAAVVTSLVDDPTAAVAVARAGDLVRGCWLEAAREGLDDPRVATAARICFDAARAALVRGGADAAIVDSTDAFGDRFVHRRRCPADDLVDAFAHGGRLLPPADNAMLARA